MQDASWLCKQEEGIREREVGMELRSGIVCYDVYVYFFFFKQKTAYEIYQCDWSSDVCSSDLEEPHPNYNRIMLSPVLAGEKTIDDIILNDAQWYKDRKSVV